jgi:hypothetical protein
MMQTFQAFDTQPAALILELDYPIEALYNESKSELTYAYQYINEGGMLCRRA